MKRRSGRDTGSLVLGMRCLYSKKFLGKSADIEWMTGDMVTHYTPSGYAGRYDGRSTVLTSLRLWSPKFDSNGWIIGGYDMDAG